MANSFIICFAFIAGFLVAKTYVDLVESPLGQAGTFWLYGGICALGGVFTAVFVPETRNKSVEEIQDYFAGRSRVIKVSGGGEIENGTQMQLMKWDFQCLRWWGKLSMWLWSFLYVFIIFYALLLSSRSAIYKSQIYLFNENSPSVSCKILLWREVKYL